MPPSHVLPSQTPLASTTATTSPAAPRLVAIAVGYRHSCALMNGGGVVCWGQNDSGQLGDGSKITRSIPVIVSGLGSGVKAVGVGWGFSCALTTGGAVKCWGDNASGQLGDGTKSGQSTPVDVSGLASGVAAIAVGFNHACAMMMDGDLRCWGDNYFGGLGNGTNVDSAVPVEVSGLANDTVDVDAGYRFTCAVTSAGGVKCWGLNDAGQLGDGTTTNRFLPGDVSGLEAGVGGVESGENHSCALLSGGGARCWGSNSHGQLGNQGYGNSPTPVEVTVVPGGIFALAAGDSFTCVRLAGDSVKCWGDNTYGMLGDGTTSLSRVAVDVIGLADGVFAIAAGEYNACALTASSARCWGFNHRGQLGNGAVGFVVVPGEVSGLGAVASSIAAGANHTCARTALGDVECWGHNYYAQLGDGSQDDRALPVAVSALGGEASAIAPGYTHTCALLATGRVRCWGMNYYGQLGDGTTTPSKTPVDVTGLSAGVTAIAAGSHHTCALMASGTVKCWGRNNYGQVGNGTTTDQKVPVDVAASVTAIAAGWGHTCAVTAAGDVKCWGWNGLGQLGDGTTTSSPTPVAVNGLAGKASAITTGYYHTCALTETGGAKCWGDNYYGQLGDGTTTKRPTPVDVSGMANGVGAIAAGYYHTCAQTVGGGLKCWGENDNGQLGDGTLARRQVPTAVNGLSNHVAGMAPGGSHTCARLDSGAVQCWGYNLYGQLGNGELGYSTAPVDVITVPVLYLPLVQR